MKKIACLPLVLCIYLTSFCQREVPEFGKTSPADFLAKAPAFEPDATALKLFDLTEVEFDYDFYGSKIKTERRVRIKILSESGFDHASIHIPYFSKKHVSKIKSLKGAVYTFDAQGGVATQRLEKKDFFRNEADDNIATVNFTFPNLKAGSVIEYSYTKIENDILELDSWDVQDEMPCLYAANTVIIPDRSRLKYKSFGLNTVEHLTQTIKGDREKHTFYKENISSFRHEPYMTSYRDNLLRLVFFTDPAGQLFYRFGYGAG